MKTNSLKPLILAGAVLFGYCGTAEAITISSINGVALGSVAPTSSLGGFSLTPFAPDLSPDGNDVNAIGPVAFSQTVRHDVVGIGWGTWSHGYAGSVYDTGSSVNPTTLTLTLASPVSAFYFYVESVNFTTTLAGFSFTATSQDGTVVTQTIDGNGGAAGFGFYTTGLDMISSISILSGDAEGFAVGEFGGSGGSQTAPDGGNSLALLGVGLLALCLGRFVTGTKIVSTATKQFIVGRGQLSPLGNHAGLAVLVILGLMVSSGSAAQVKRSSLLGKSAVALSGYAFPGTDALGAGLSPVAFGSIDPFVTESGFVALSVDGLGTTSSSGTIRVLKPAGATVRKAYLFSASTGFSGYHIPIGGVTINGSPVSFSIETPSNINSFNYLADVTSLIKPTLDAAAAGTNLLTITEGNSGSIDGEVLAVIFDDPNQISSSTVVLLFGAQKVAGDTFNVTLSDPIDLAKADLILNMSLGISYSYQTTSTTSQFSFVTVNGNQLTQSAGGQDDGQAANGALITVGGIGDSIANPLPFQTVANFNTDDELYSLIPFVTNGATSITVFTRNPSVDDNIFFSALVVSGGAVVNEGILLSPINATNEVGTSHTVTATVQDSSGHAVANRQVTFTILGGPNAGVTSTSNTDGSGHASFTYFGTGGVGVDTINARMIGSTGKTITSGEVIKKWVLAVCPAPALTITPRANRGYYQVGITSSCYATSELQFYVSDTASAFMAGPYAAGTVVKIKKSATTGTGPGSGPASVTVKVLGNGQINAVDPAGHASAAITCLSF